MNERQFWTRLFFMWESDYSAFAKGFEMFGLLRQRPLKVQSELIWGLGPFSSLRLVFHWDDRLQCNREGRNRSQAFVSHVFKPPILLKHDTYPFLHLLTLLFSLAAYLVSLFCCFLSSSLSNSKGLNVMLILLALSPAFTPCLSKLSPPLSPWPTLCWATS